MTHSTPNRKLLNTDKLLEEGRQTGYFGRVTLKTSKLRVKFPKKENSSKSGRRF